MSLLTKLVLIFSAILVVAFGLLNAIIAAQIVAQNDETINSEQQALMESCSTYVVSFFLEESLSATGAGFVTAAEGIARDLSVIFAKPVAAYMSDGTSLYEPPEFLGVEGDDVEVAKQGVASYTVVSRDDHVSVYLSVPVLSEEGTIGVLRMYTDYTDMYEDGYARSSTMLIETLIAIGIGFILVIIVIHRVLRPVRHLRDAMIVFRKNPKSHNPLVLERNDEIGQLTLEYNKMAETIVAQMDTIEEEKAVLADTIRYRKEFFDNVTHELKTPITIIMGYSDMLKDTDPTSEFFATGLENIAVESRRLSNMVTELLEESRFSHSARIAPEKVDIKELIAGLCETMGLKAGRYDVKLNLDFKAPIISRGNKEQLRRLFVNLIDNAIKYSKSGDVIEIVGFVRDENVVVEVKNKLQQEIRAERLEDIFTPFTRLEDSAEKGSVGLGLSICKDIVDEHGGTIGATLTNDNKSITVTVTLKKSEEKA